MLLVLSKYLSFPLSISLLFLLFLFLSISPFSLFLSLSLRFSSFVFHSSIMTRSKFSFDVSMTHSFTHSLSLSPLTFSLSMSPVLFLQFRVSCKNASVENALSIEQEDHFCAEKEEKVKLLLNLLQQSLLLLLLLLPLFLMPVFSI